MRAYEATDIPSVTWNKHDGLVIQVEDGGRLLKRRTAGLASLAIDCSLPPLRESKYPNEPVQNRIGPTPETITLKLIVHGGANDDTRKA